MESPTVAVPFFFLFQGEARPKILHSSLFILHLSLVASLEIIFKIIFRILEGKAPVQSNHRSLAEG